MAFPVLQTCAASAMALAIRVGVAFQPRPLKHRSLHFNAAL
jgi:hypothetical protein